MDVARRVAQKFRQAAAGEEGADRLVIPQAVGAQAVQAQGSAGENDQHQQQPMSGAEFHELSLAQAGDDPKLQGAAKAGNITRLSIRMLGLSIKACYTDGDHGGLGANRGAANIGAHA